jgi:peptide-methionine (R)-S-oxide reductase
MKEMNWKEVLTPEEYHILREKGTERPFSGKYNNFFEEGKYVCAGCGTVLFTDEQKFQSSCGWPSFDDAIPNTIEETRDLSYGMVRTEITCKKCGGHLGHIFDDGPTKTGLRYCVNSVSIKFEEK